MAETRPSYETADGRLDEDRLRKYVTKYDGPEDPDYPGCVPIPMTVEQFDDYEGGVEYWSRERGTALICRDGGPAHEIPGGMLPGLLTRIEMERGSPIRCCGALKMVTEDPAGQSAEGMHPDQSIYLRPGTWLPSGRSTVVGRDPRPGRRSRSRQHDGRASPQAWRLRSVGVPRGLGGDARRAVAEPTARGPP